MASAAERQAAYRARQAIKGVRPVTVMVPEGHVDAFKVLAGMLAENPNLIIGTLRNVQNGQLVRFNG
jgi:hypothetical protein